MGQRWVDGYSADVEIFLRHGGKKFDVAQVGGGSMILRQAAPLPAGAQVDLVIVVDGSERVHSVCLTNPADVVDIPVGYV